MSRASVFQVLNKLLKKIQVSVTLNATQSSNFSFNQLHIDTSKRKQLDSTNILLSVYICIA